MHDLVNHATLSGKTQCECKSLLSHNRVQYASSNIHKTRVQILDRLSVTFLVNLTKIYMYLSPGSSALIPTSFPVAYYTACNSKYDDATIGFPAEVGHGFFFPPSCSTACNVMYSFGASERAARETHRVFVEAAALS